MPDVRLACCALASTLGLAALDARAQRHPADSALLAVGVTLGASTPIVPTQTLGSDGVPVAAGMVAIYRPLRHVVVEAEGDVYARVLDGGYVTGRLADRRVLAYDDNVDGFLATAVRAGVERAPGRLGLRAAAGVGRLWGLGSTFGTATATATARVGRPRVLLTVDRWWYTLAATEWTHDGRRYVLGSNVPRRVRASPTALRVGFEFPVVSR